MITHWTDRVRWWTPVEEDGVKCSHLFLDDEPKSLCYVRARVEMLELPDLRDPPLACLACKKRREKGREWMRQK